MKGNPVTPFHGSDVSCKNVQCQLFSRLAVSISVPSRSNCNDLNQPRGPTSRRGCENARENEWRNGGGGGGGGEKRKRAKGAKRCRNKSSFSRENRRERRAQRRYDCALHGRHVSRAVISFFMGGYAPAIPFARSRFQTSSAQYLAGRLDLHAGIKILPPATL